MIHNCSLPSYHVSRRLQRQAKSLVEAAFQTVVDFDRAILAKPKPEQIVPVQHQMEILRFP